VADIYLRSTDGSDADSGPTWALAKATIAGVEAIDVAGDRIFISQVHAESTAAAITIDIAGTLASPSQVLCANDGAEPPTALATTGTITTTGTSAITITGTFYWYGTALLCGSGAVNLTLAIGEGTSSHQVYEDSLFHMVATGATGVIRLGSTTTAGETSIECRNCTFRFSNTTHGLRLVNAKGLIRGGGLHASGSAITTLIKNLSGNSGDQWVVQGFDASSGAASMNLLLSGADNAGTMILRDCKLPASWSGSLLGGAPLHMGFRAEMYNCDSADTNYRLWIEDYSGSIKHETTLVKTGGASDGTTPLSWKMATGADAEYPTIILKSGEIVRWNETTGSAITVTVDILHDSVTNLKDNEIWLEVMYLGTSGVPLGAFVDDAVADVLAAAADQAASSATWTTTGMANPNKQKLEVTFTPQEKGFIHAVVHMAKASYTVYVDPVQQVS